MKKILLIVIAALFTTLFVKAQTVEIVPFGGYVFASRMNADGGDIYFHDNAQYGGMISIGVSRVMDVDLIYNRIDTKADVNAYYYYGNPFTQSIPLSINYMQVGFTKNFRVNPTVSPFVGFNLGACLMDPKEDYTATWFFSIGMNGGAKVYFAKNFGIRLQAQMYLPVQGAGFSMFAGTGGGGGGATVYSSMVQFGFTGGLIFRLGKVN